MKVQVLFYSMSALFILFLSHQTFPQSYISDKIRFRHLTREQGLSDSFIRCVIQDSKGFLWIGTSDGLDRYDGYNLKVFKFSPNDINSLGANSIRALYEDKLGTLWVGTLGGGLNKYISGQEMFTRYFNDPLR